MGQTDKAADSIWVQQIGCGRCMRPAVILIWMQTADCTMGKNAARIADCFARETLGNIMNDASMLSVWFATFIYRKREHCDWVRVVAQCLRKTQRLCSIRRILCNDLSARGAGGIHALVVEIDKHGKRLSCFTDEFHPVHVFCREIGDGGIKAHPGMHHNPRNAMLMKIVQLTAYFPAGQPVIQKPERNRAILNIRRSK